MSVHPVLLIVWATLAACFGALLVYRGQLTRYEDEQLFLNNEGSNEEARQSEIVRKVRRIEPLVRGLGGAAGLVTAGVVGLYVWHAWQILQ